MIGDDVYQCSARELEGKGAEIVIKKSMNKEYGLQLTDLTTDGDQNAKKISEEGVWKRTDEKVLGTKVPDDFIGKKVIPKPPNHHKGYLLILES